MAYNFPISPRTKDVLQKMHSTTMVEAGRAKLPAEIISTILDFLPVRDLMAFGRTSRRMADMVYDDTRWVQRLKSMGCWNENEARARFDQGMRRRWEVLKTRKEEEYRRAGIGVAGADGARRPSTMLFDATVEEERLGKLSESMPKTTKDDGAIDGFENLSLAASASASVREIAGEFLQEPTSFLNVFSTVRSLRGGARQEYGKIYGALAPFYYDLARSRSHVDPIIFRVYRDPEQQSQMLSQLHRFARSDWARGWEQRQERLETMLAVFENAVLREFERGYEHWDIDGTMHRYAHVLYYLNGGHAGEEMFIHKHPIFSEWHKFGNPMDCIDHAPEGEVALEPSREFFLRLSASLVEQADLIDRIFPQEMDVMQVLMDKVGEDIISEYLNPLFDEAHGRNIESYLKAVSGIFEQAAQFSASLVPSEAAGDSFKSKVDEVLAKVFEPHVDLYLQEELDFFKAQAETEVASWEAKLSEQDASTESFFMGNINRQADKKDFLSSFKKVVMMPVNVLPSFGTGKHSTPADAIKANLSNSSTPSRLPNPTIPGTSNRILGGTTDELAAKAAIMASRLEGIKSLFSIEVALSLVHLAKASLERVVLFVRLGGQTGEEAREQCLALFVALLQILGTKHIKNGFDKAVASLSSYNPREVSKHQGGVAPLVAFLELVNVGDLISQMVDVFYEQQLVTAKLTDRNDFLDPAVKAKKNFEQVLDERVAAGLNKGIDVLMNEVDYVFATTHFPADYNPMPIVPGSSSGSLEIGPTKAAREVVAIVSSRTKVQTPKRFIEALKIRYWDWQG